MPKKRKYPRLRTHVRKGANGQVYTYYYYDMRPDGERDINLGANYTEALRWWDELYNKKPRVVGTLEEAFQKWEAEALPKYENPETRKNYKNQMERIRKWCKDKTWDQVKLPDLVKYLEMRSAKTQANREMAVLSIIWNRARTWGLTELPWPAAGMKKSKWKNDEAPREFEVTPELFLAVYEFADPTLRDCMDIASATGMRLTDCRMIVMPTGNTLNLKASKTGKRVDFDITQSSVLPSLVERRKALKAKHLRLLSTPTGRPVSYRMLRDRWDEAREKAAGKAMEEGKKALAEKIRAMYLRDMRKFAADLAGSVEEASKLLQHSSKRLTETHYRQRADVVKPVR